MVHLHFKGSVHIVLVLKADPVSGLLHNLVLLGLGPVLPDLGPVLLSLCLLITFTKIRLKCLFSYDFNLNTKISRKHVINLFIE